MVPQQKSHLNNSKLDCVFVIGYYGHRSYSTFIMLIHTKKKRNWNFLDNALQAS